jgi:hypothetical protein
MLSLRCHRSTALVEVYLVLAYSGKEYVATSLALDQEDGPANDPRSALTPHAPGSRCAVLVIVRLPRFGRR